MTTDTLKIDSGNSELDKKIDQWLSWDKVRKILQLIMIHEMTEN